MEAAGSSLKFCELTCRMAGELTGHQCGLLAARDEIYYWRSPGMGVRRKTRACFPN